MTPERYRFLSDEPDNDKVQLTEAEMAEGWHFCQDYDYLLIGPDCIEMESCLCNVKEPK